MHRLYCSRSRGETPTPFLDTHPLHFAQPETGNGRPEVELHARCSDVTEVLVYDRYDVINIVCTSRDELRTERMDGKTFILFYEKIVEEYKLVSDGATDGMGITYLPVPATRRSSLGDRTLFAVAGP